MSVPAPFNAIFGDDELVLVTRAVEAGKNLFVDAVNRASSATGLASHDITDTRGSVVARVPLRVSNAHTVPQIALALGTLVTLRPAETVAAMTAVASGQSARGLYGEQQQIRGLFGIDDAIGAGAIIAGVIGLMTAVAGLWTVIFKSGVITHLLEMVHQGPGGDSYLAPGTSNSAPPAPESFTQHLTALAQAHPMLVLAGAALAAFVIYEEL